MISPSVADAAVDMLAQDTERLTWPSFRTSLGCRHNPRRVSNGAIIATITKRTTRTTVMLAMMKTSAVWIALSMAITPMDAFCPTAAFSRYDGLALSVSSVLEPSVGECMCVPISDVPLSMYGGEAYATNSKPYFGSPLTCILFPNPYVDTRITLFDRQGCLHCCNR